MRRLAPNWTPIHSLCPLDLLIILYVAIRYRRARRWLLSLLRQTKRHWQYLPAPSGLHIIE